MVQIATNSPNSFGFTALRSIMMEGSESVVTAIIKESTVPSCAPLNSSASATGIVPKMSAYMGELCGALMYHESKFVNDNLYLFDSNASIERMLTKPLTLEQTSSDAPEITCQQM